jgi:hypothetical protein
MGAGPVLPGTSRLRSPRGGTAPEVFMSYGFSARWDQQDTALGESSRVSRADAVIEASTRGGSGETVWKKMGVVKTM